MARPLWISGISSPHHSGSLQILSTCPGFSLPPTLQTPISLCSRVFSHSGIQIGGIPAPVRALSNLSAHRLAIPFLMWPQEKFFFNFINSFFLSLFIYFDKRERQRERGRERIPSRFHTVSAEPDAGLELMNCQIMTWVEIMSWMLNRLSHRGTLSFFFLIFNFNLRKSDFPSVLWYFLSLLTCC